jgi:hypothetical protein
MSRIPATAKSFTCTQADMKALLTVSVASIAVIRCWVLTLRNSLL